MNPYKTKELAERSIADTKEIPKLEIRIIKRYSKKGHALFDLGSNNGRLLEALFENGYTNLWGIEESKWLVEYSKRQNGKIQYIENSIFDCHLKECADCILALHFFTSMQNDKERTEAIKIAKGMLRPNGKIIIKSFLSNKEKDIRTIQAGIEVRIFIPDRDKWIIEFERNGLRLIKELVKVQNGNTVLYLAFKN